jgi:hypothetical protein
MGYIEGGWDERGRIDRGCESGLGGKGKVEDENAWAIG